VLAVEGPTARTSSSSSLIDAARAARRYLPFSANTAYINTIPTEAQVRLPGDQESSIASARRALERDGDGAAREQAHQRRRPHRELRVRGHAVRRRLQSLLARAVGQHGGDLVFFQGHSATGVYARAFMLGRLTEAQLDSYRQEVGGRGISSYPHPWLMPDFWQFPTVSMGLGPLMAIYQARFMKYLQDRGLAQTEGRKVWALMGDGEMDEPESMGAIGMASRENLDNLIFVVNCNLQRLDGPVRGNGKIIQELESDFRGAGWNVIKVIWGTHWDALLARDKKGILMKRMMEALDGEYQTFKSKDGAYVREYFFNTPELKALVADYTDDDIWHLNRGGHDPHKIYAAFHAAVNHKGQPTVILAKTIKGYGMGTSGEAQNITHQQKKMSHESLARFRDRFEIPVPDDKLDEIPYVTFSDGSPELEYMRARRMELGGYNPQRRRKASTPLPVPELSAFERFLKSTEDREISTTMAFVQILQVIIRDKEHRQARRAYRARRVAHVRHGGHVPPARHLEPAGAALHAAGPRPAHVLQGGQARPDPPGRHQRSGRHVRLDRGGDVVLHARRADDPVLHLLFDVRASSAWATSAGPRATCARADSCSAEPRAHDAQWRGAAARGRATRTSCRQRCRTACRTTPRSRTRWR
jgi:pyruvate dehydrogenase E1 component